MKIKLSHLLSLLAGLLMLSSCADAIAPDIKKGVQVVRYLSAKRQISRSSFIVVYPEAKPSDFVNWMFSGIGAAEWPDSEAYAELDPMVREQAQSIGAPLIPKDVQIVPLNPNVEMEKQVVVKFDDGRGVIIVEGYLDPREPPILVQEWALPRVDSRPS